MEPCAREGAMSTAIPIADIGQKYLVTRQLFPYGGERPTFARRLKFCSTGELKMLKRILSGCAVTACVIGSAPPAHAVVTDCWFWEPDTVGTVTSEDCDVTLRTTPSSRTTSGYLRTWIIRDQNSEHTLEAVLWEDETAELTFIDRQGNVTAQVEGTHWVDSDGDTRIDMTEGYQMAFTRPTSDYGAGAAYPPALGGGREHYQPTRGGGLSSGEFSDRPFAF